MFESDRIEPLKKNWVGKTADYFIEHYDGKHFLLFSDWEKGNKWSKKPDENPKFGNYVIVSFDLKRSRENLVNALNWERDYCPSYVHDYRVLCNAPTMDAFVINQMRDISHSNPEDTVEGFFGRKNSMLYVRRNHQDDALPFFFKKFYNPNFLTDEGKAFGESFLTEKHLPEENLSEKNPYYDIMEISKEKFDELGLKMKTIADENVRQRNEIGNFMNDFLIGWKK